MKELYWQLITAVAVVAAWTLQALKDGKITEEEAKDLAFTILSLLISITDDTKDTEGK